MKAALLLIAIVVVADAGPARPAYVASVATYPGYDGPLSPRGQIFASQKIGTQLNVQFDLTGLEAGTTGGKRHSLAMQDRKVLAHLMQCIAPTYTPTCLSLRVAHPHRHHL
jgi:uncharacterized protein YaiI (UPF0178 family)